MRCVPVARATAACKSGGYVTPLGGGGGLGWPPLLFFQPYNAVAIRRDKSLGGTLGDTFKKGDAKISRAGNARRDGETRDLI